MPVFQFELAAVLAASALVSTILLYYFDFKSRRSHDEGRIRLPEDEAILPGGDSVTEPYRDEPETEGGEDDQVWRGGKGKNRQSEVVFDEKDEKDPFDVTTPMDMVDGRPIDEGGFWSQMRLRKLLIILVLALLLATNCFALGWDLILADSHEKWQWRQIATATLHIVLALYATIVASLTLARPVVDGDEFVDPLASHGKSTLNHGLGFTSSATSTVRGRSAGPSTSPPSESTATSISDAAFVLSDPRHRTKLHCQGIIHLCVVSSLAFFGLVIIGVLPKSAAPSTTIGDDVVSTVAYLVQLVGWGVVWFVVSRMDMGPQLVFPMERMYSEKILEVAAAAGAEESGIEEAKKAVKKEGEVCGQVGASIWSTFLFSYTTPVIRLGYTATSLEVGDLPIVPASMRAANIFKNMREGMRNGPMRYLDPRQRQRYMHSHHQHDVKQRKSLLERLLPKALSNPTPGSGWTLFMHLIKMNKRALVGEILLIVVSALLFYAPAFFLQRVVRSLEYSPDESEGGARDARRWGWAYVVGLSGVSAVTYLVTGQLWSLATCTLQVRMKIQLNTILFAKTLVRKDVASSSGSSTTATDTRAPSPSNSATATTTDVTSSTSKPKNIDSTAPPPKDGSKTAPADIDAAETSASGTTAPSAPPKDKDEEAEFSSKAQIMTLMTTDVDRVSEFAWHCFALFDSPIELVIGTLFLYSLLGVSAFFGLITACLLLPLNQFASKFVVVAQDNLMKARDERVALMNEVLGAIRMLKFMAWERSFEARVLKVREKELRYQRLNFLLENAFNFIWAACPIFVTLLSFFHFAVIRQQQLTPSVAFTSIAVLSEMQFALNTLPETFVQTLQSLVSLRRIEKYLYTVEVEPVAPLASDHNRRHSKQLQPETFVAMQSATISWPQDRSAGTATSTHTGTSSGVTSVSSTPKRKFSLIDVSVRFPPGELSLVCGKLGAGKTLMLLALLGEADLLAGQIICPRTPPNALASFAGVVPKPEDWIVEGVCAFVPQTAWLRNASIRDNILFNLPYVKERYEKTLEVCALKSDLKILEDGDESEIGERGVNLSGGQKARVSLARAIYSRASILFLDDVLSAVDAHTAHHLFNECIKGELTRGRTIILVSHHVQLCASGAKYVVALDNGRVTFAGGANEFKASGAMASLVQSDSVANLEAAKDQKEEKPVEKLRPKSPEASESSGGETETTSEISSTAAPSTNAEGKADVESKKKAPRKLIGEEKRAVGRIGREIWKSYFWACGGKFYWMLFIFVFTANGMGPVFEKGWLRIWSKASMDGEPVHGPMYYISIYALASAFGLIVGSLQWFTLYEGSIHASTILYKRLLERVLFTDIRFHDTISRGRLLNRFGKDFEGIDSSLSDNFGRSVRNALSVSITLTAVSIVGGWPFLFALFVLAILYWNVSKVYGQCSRDMRRLDSVSRSPLYSMYGETIAGVPVVRAFGAGSKFLRDMISCVDTNTNPYFWLWGVNRWVSVRFNLLSCAVVGCTAAVCLINPRIDASLAGFALAFASTVTNDLLFMVRRFVSLEQSMVAVERVKEYSELPPEGPEHVDPRPPAEWPSKGSVSCENLIIRYAPDLPDVLHNLTFTVNPGEKIGILGRTGSGKSTLALSFFRFVEATEGRIVIDDIDIAKIGLTDLRSRLTIIPQDPTILSGTLRSTLDVFDEYQDAEIFEALRRVHLIPSDDIIEDPEEINANVFRNLDSPVSEGGENFSTGEKQLLCMARAILKRSKLLVMDEATASVDYATDELISSTIRQQFAESTILTIAHRLRTVIDYSRIMLLDEGRIVEFDRPATLLSDPSSRFYALCRAAGKEEFEVLKKMAGVTSS